MATSFLTNLNLEVKKSDKLFFDQYSYCIKVLIDEASALKKLDHDTIDAVLDLRHNLSRNRTYGSSLWKKRKFISQDLRENLHKTCDFLKDLNEPFKLLFCGNSIFYIYTNQLELAQDLHTHTPLTVVKIFQRQINRPKNTIKLKKTDKKVRAFFECKYLSMDEKSNLNRFFKNNLQEFRLSPSVELFFETNNYYFSQANFFIDASDQKLIDMINLIVPGLIRKTMPIVTDK